MFEFNGYSLDIDLYEELLLKLYGFEEYYYYKNDRYYNDYLFVLRQLERIKENKKIDVFYKNAILGWYISFKNLKRFLSPYANGFSITDACQLKCKHCYNQNVSRQNGYISFDEFKEIYYKHNDYMKSFVHYTTGERIKCYHIEGGEPTLNKDLVKMLTFLQNENVMFSLLTNGLFIPDELYQFFKKDSNNEIQISLDGLKENHNFIRGDGTFEKTMNTIKNLYENKINFHTNFVYTSKNYKDLYELKEYLKPYDCFHKGIMRYIDQQNNFIRELTKEEMSFSEYYSYFNERPCLIGNQSQIFFNGGFGFCNKMNHYPVANFFNDTKDDFLFKVKLFTIRSRSVPVYCFDCKNVNFCLGGQMCSSYTKYKMFNIEDTKCHILNKKEKNGVPYPIDDLY